MLAAGAGAGERMTHAFAGLAQAIIDGRMPSAIASLFIVARVVLIPKRDGGVRPLGIVGLLRRVVCRGVAQQLLRETLPWLVQRGQLGAGAPAGTEALAALVQMAYDGATPLSVLLLDRRNAYSSVHPDAARLALRCLAPAYAAFADALLGPALLFARGMPTREWRGLLQGCPLSPLLFAIVLEAALDRGRARLRQLRVQSGAFLDDGVLVGEVENLEAALRVVRECGARVGLKLNEAKSVALVSARALAAAGGRLPDGLAGMKLESHGARVLGVPVGTDEYRAAACVAIVEEATAVRRRVAGRLSSQAQLYLLRLAAGWPAVLHAFRATPPRLAERAAAI